MAEFSKFTQSVRVQITKPTRRVSEERSQAIPLRDSKGRSSVDQVLSSMRRFAAGRLRQMPVSTIPMRKRTSSRLRLRRYGWAFLARQFDLTSLTRRVGSSWLMGWRGDVGPGRLGSLFGVALGLVMVSGCASMTAKLSELPGPLPSLSSSVPPAQTNQALADPKNQELKIALETARLAEQRSMDAEAIAAYEKVRDLNPGQPGVAHALAVLYDRAAMTDAARREYSAAMAESPGDPDVLCDYGYFLYSTGDLEKSEETLREALAADTTHRQATVNLAVVLAGQREYEEAKRLFEQAIGPAAASHNIGMFKLRQGEVADGKRMIAAALQKDPSLRRSEAVLESVGQADDAPHHLASEAKATRR